ncbi:MAG: tRNA lysidine(34) synthetase TilS [Chitinophagaceae bacterium]
MNLHQQFLENIKTENLFALKQRLLLAVSGGVDSVVLCELCYLSGIDFIIAHCNFQLRAEESERDEKFVVQLGIKYNKQAIVERFDTHNYASKNKVSTQVAARELRYSWFYELLDKPPRYQLPTPGSEPDTINYLLTAHHADDNIETVLMNFFKGTGIAGLRGIPPKQGKIIRPLLNFRKEELLVFANQNNLKWVEDSSNSTDKYSRNYFRQQVIPLVQKIYPKANENILSNIHRFADTELLYQQAISFHKKSLLEIKGNEVHIPVLKLKKAIPLLTIVYEIIKEYNFTPAQTTEAINLLNSESSKYIASPTHRLIRNRNWLIIAPVATTEAETILIEKGTTILQQVGFRLNFSELPASGSLLTNSSSIAQVDLKNIDFPLLLRKWKTGDYFYPLGMKKKKKLSRFFIDSKLSKTEKENVWVLESAKKIVWVIGYRIDERFKITDTSRQLLQITFQPE